MNARIASIRPLEILDSRGNPTLRVFLTLDNGWEASASVPSGASTGENEAVELRDGDPRRYGGKGVSRAAANVREKIAPALFGLDPSRQSEIDNIMIDVDGTPTKGNLGANAMLGVSMAVARAAALSRGLPLYAYVGGAWWRPSPHANDEHPQRREACRQQRGLPGIHGRACGRSHYAEALRYGVETFHALKGILRNKGYTTAVGDEGGFAPNLKSNEEACEVIVAAIKAAGYTPGKDVAIALDPAPSWSVAGCGSRCRRPTGR